MTVTLELSQLCSDVTKLKIYFENVFYQHRYIDIIISFAISSN